MWQKRQMTTNTLAEQVRKWFLSTKLIQKRKVNICRVWNTPERTNDYMLGNRIVLINKVFKRHEILKNFMPVYIDNSFWVLFFWGRGFANESSHVQFGKMHIGTQKRASPCILKQSFAINIIKTI